VSNTQTQSRWGAVVLLTVTSVALGLVSCRDTRVMGGKCGVDADCATSMTSSLVIGAQAAAYRCEAQTGVCYCRTDDACPPSQLCNGLGFCQDRSGCTTNADCGSGNLFCDTSVGECVPKGRCSSDLQCELGQVCDFKKGSCVAGCRKNGDCGGTSCRCGDVACSCTGTSPAELARCRIGVCDPAFCASNDFCNFGEQCAVLPDAGVTSNEPDAGPRAQCFSDYDQRLRPYCDNCVVGAGGLQVCGSGPNYCLIDTRNAGNFFCGADCSEGQACPRGYGCQDVIVVLTQWSCTRSNPACPINPMLPCTTDADCRRGGVCGKNPGEATGFCAGRCSVDEGDEQGFCSCQVDSDCAPESCMAGECSISRKKCVTADDCKSIRCVDFAGAGGCLIGQNCAPASGLSCNDVRGMANP